MHDFCRLRATHLEAFEREILARTKPKHPEPKSVRHHCSLSVCVTWRLITLEDCESSSRLGVAFWASKSHCGSPVNEVYEGLEVYLEDLPEWLGEVYVTLAQGEYGEDWVSWAACSGLGVRDCVSSSLNTQPLQPDIQLRQQLELVYQIIIFTKLTGSISSTLSFPHSCVVQLFISVFEDFDWRLSQFP